MLILKSGFTILEILIVFVIIAIMSSIVVLNVNVPSYSGFMANAHKIAAIMSLINDEAVYTNSVIICKPENNKLSCTSYKNGEFTDLDMRKISSWTWPDEMHIVDILINGVKMKQNENIRFFATGDQVPLSLKITNDKYSTWIDGDLGGNFTINN